MNTNQSSVIANAFATLKAHTEEVAGFNVPSPHRCAAPGCPRVGHWYTNRGRAAGRLCDTHYSEFMDREIEAAKEYELVREI